MGFSLSMLIDSFEDLDGVIQEIKFRLTRFVCSGPPSPTIVCYCKVFCFILFYFKALLLLGADGNGARTRMLRPLHIAGLPPSRKLPLCRRLLNNTGIQFEGPLQERVGSLKQDAIDTDELGNGSQTSVRIDN
nr:hypothetical protein F15G10.2 - Caenorhabditis elegans [Caenorhabditis elegans]